MGVRSRTCTGLGASVVLALAVLPMGVVAQDGSPAASGFPTPLLPTIDLSAVGGEGEGELNIIVWGGYAEDGSNVPEYDWVHGFQDATGCQVKSKPDDTSDQMVTDMRTNAYDGVSASGDASLRLISAGDIAEIDVAAIPGFSDVAPFLQDAPHYVVDGKHYGVPHGWGGNSLMYNTEIVTPAPTSWDAVFHPSQAIADGRLVTAYDSPIYIADAALYLKAHQPELGITDVYELTPEQLDAAVVLLKAQAPTIEQYWSLYGVQIDNFTTGISAVGTTWPYQVNALKAAGLPVEAIVPTEGMTGWADTWMMSSTAAHPNCMLKWMAWMLTPEVQTQVAEYFGEAPANPLACQYLDVGYGSYQFPGFCDKFGVNDPAFYGSIAFWKTPQTDCGDDRGAICTDYDLWTRAWRDIRG